VLAVIGVALIALNPAKPSVERISVDVLEGSDVPRNLKSGFAL
jgi:hypothetical protein